jgi:prophage regulatory protein
VHHQTTHSDLPPTGYLRQTQIIGRVAVSEAEAEANKHRGKGPRRARGALPAIVPWSAPTLWRMVKARHFPAPVKLSDNVTAWLVEDVRAWLTDKAAKRATVAA